MAKTDEPAGFWGELFRFDLYKRNQGRLTRQITAVALLLTAAIGAWVFSSAVLVSYGRMAQTLVPAGVVLIAGWFAFRIVNYPRFADFLISVQAEMDKVTWPSKTELYRATVVVIGTMVILAVMLFGFDLFWVWLFRLLGVLTGTE